MKEENQRNSKPPNLISLLQSSPKYILSCNVTPIFCCSQPHTYKHCRASILWTSLTPFTSMDCIPTVISDN